MMTSSGAQADCHERGGDSEEPLVAEELAVGAYCLSHDERCQEGGRQHVHDAGQLGLELTAFSSRRGILPWPR
jgi:hypothetical protein